MTTDSSADDLLLPGPALAGLALAAPGLSQVLAQAEQMLSGAAGTASPEQARALLMSCEKVARFIGAASLAAVIAEMAEALAPGAGDVQERGESVRRKCKVLRAYLDELDDLGTGLAPPAQEQEQSSEHRSSRTAALTAMIADVARIEAVLENRLGDGGVSAGDMASVAALCERLAAVSLELKLETVAEVFAACAADMQNIPDAGEPDAVVRARLTHNIAVLSLSLPVMRATRSASMPYAGLFVGETSQEQVDAAPEQPAALPELAPSEERASEEEIDADMLEIFLLEARDILQGADTALAFARAEPGNIAHVASLRRAFHTLKGSGRMVGLNALAEGAMAFENFLNVWLAEGRAGSVDDYALLEHAVQEMAAWVEDIAQNGNSRRRPDALLKAIADGRHAAARSGDEIEDTIDLELLDIFLEEGRDLLPQIGESLQRLQRTPGDTALIQYLLRPLHTIKGSARMAGAMRLGQHMHDLESRISEMLRDHEPSAALVEELLARYDHGLQLFDALQAPPALVASAADLSAGNAPRLAGTEPLKVRNATGATTLVRIRADILDSLLNQAGEISISRSGLASEVNVLRDYLNDLGGNVARLGAQLREVGIQAEIHIAASNQRSPQHQHFDPLEFDRFTHLQELTRMLAESVNDVASLQKNLMDAVEHTQNSLVHQARLTREMQRELMQARMVQFKGVEERLHRLVRQMSKETGKKLELEITGGAVKLDRSILAKMVGPFEHLLRNAAVHGIETAEQRLTAGKDAIGRLLLEVRQEGNEAMIRLADDGQGLNLARIHEKALHLGLIHADQRLSDAELTGLIFHPGFSTSSNVTAIAGRGVGMDVVRSEVASLGGRISINSLAGKGAQFIIHLPLSLAVTQVVLLELKEQIYAIPSLLVEQVLQLKAAEQEKVFRAGVLEWQGRKLAVHYLASLLGDDGDVPPQHTIPVMVVKSGHHFFAILVDRVIGNREVATKNIGPQVAGMIGIVGATVLGSRGIVLILNPIQLAQHHGYQKILRHAGPLLAHDGAGQKTVLVVDDSLTVRRVMHRLLTREGYHVVLATDGVDALHQLQNLRPDIVLLDIEMPRMDGFDLARNIREIADTASLPIIMITSRTAAKHRERAMELGVNAYLGKPYQDDVLLKLVHGLIENDGVRPAFCVDDVLFQPAALPPEE